MFIQTDTPFQGTTDPYCNYTGASLEHNGSHLIKIEVVRFNGDADLLGN